MLSYGQKECEDSNASALDNYVSDGCSNQCKVEKGFKCPIKQPGPCIEICGEGSFDNYNYECDDGNNKDGDGCDKSCKLEKGFKCVGGSPNSHDEC